MRSDDVNEMGDLANYIQLLEDFREGNYEYETVQNEEDLIVAHKKGKVFIFTADPFLEKLLMGFGAFIITLMLILGLIFRIFIPKYYVIIDYILVGFGGIGAIIIVVGYIRLKRIRKKFIIVTPKGMIKGSIWGNMKTYLWKDVDVKGYIEQTSVITLGIIKQKLTPELVVRLIPINKPTVKLKPIKYDLKEFYDSKKFEGKIKTQTTLSKDEKGNLYKMGFEKLITAQMLFIATIQYYFEMNKLESSELKR